MPYTLMALKRRFCRKPENNVTSPINILRSRFYLTSRITHSNLFSMSLGNKAFHTVGAYPLHVRHEEQSYGLQCQEDLPLLVQDVKIQEIKLLPWPMLPSPLTRVHQQKRPLSNISSPPKCLLPRGPCRKGLPSQNPGPSTSSDAANAAGPT